MSDTSSLARQKSGARISQPFECVSTSASLPDSVVQDELMIDWGGVPNGAKVSIFLPDADADDIVTRAGKLYGGQRLVLADAHTISLETGRVSYIPLPAMPSGRFTGLITLELPPGLKRGQRCTVVVRQVSSVPMAERGGPNVALNPVRERYSRRVTGVFQLNIPIESASTLRYSEERALAFFRWLLSTLKPTNRWYPVMQRYVGDVALRVDGFGGNAGLIEPSSTGIVPGHDAGGTTGSAGSHSANCALICLGVLWASFSMIALLSSGFQIAWASALRPIVKAYDWLMAALLGWAEPFLNNILSQLDSQFGWLSHLHRHWMPVFILMGLYLIAVAKTHSASGVMRAILLALAGLLLALFTAVACGTIDFAGYSANAIADISVVIAPAAAIFVFQWLARGSILRALRVPAVWLPIFAAAMVALAAPAWIEAQPHPRMILSCIFVFALATGSMLEAVWLAARSRTGHSARSRLFAREATEIFSAMVAAALFVLTNVVLLGL